MVKFMGIVARKSGLTREEFLRYWRDVHAPLAAALPGLRRYVRNPTLETPGRELAYDGVAELWFDDRESLRAAFRSPEGQRVSADQTNFIAIDGSVSLVVEEVEVSLPRQR